jgi:hypothetical protein
MVEMLDTVRKTRHRCILLGDILIATRPGWDISLEVPTHARQWSPAALLALLHARRPYGRNRGTSRDRASYGPGRRLPSPAWHTPAWPP